MSELYLFFAHQMLDDDAPEDADGSKEEDLRTEIVPKERVRPRADDDSHEVPVSARNIGMPCSR